MAEVYRFYSKIIQHDPFNPDDDHVLACALAASAELIVSGDRHLLGLGNYQGIAIVNPAAAVKMLG